MEYDYSVIPFLAVFVLHPLFSFHWRYTNTLLGNSLKSWCWERLENNLISSLRGQLPRLPPGFELEGHSGVEGTEDICNQRGNRNPHRWCLSHVLYSSVPILKSLQFLYTYNGVLFQGCSILIKGCFLRVTKHSLQTDMLYKAITCHYFNDWLWPWL